MIGIIANKEGIYVESENNNVYDANDYISKLEEKVLEYLHNNLSYE